MSRFLPCLLLALTSNSFGQYTFRRWTVDEGLPQNSVNDILQSRGSYLWLATNDGLVRFDGVRFTVFNWQNTSGAIGNRVNALYEDHNGDVWIGGEGSVARLHNGAFKAFGRKSGIPTGPVQGITGDDSGNIWILFAQCVLQLRKGRFERLADSRFRPNRASGPFVHYPKTSGFWSQSSVLSVFIRGKAHYWDVSHGYRPDIRLQSVALDEHGVLWAAGNGKLFRTENDRLVSAPLPSSCSPSTEFVFVRAQKLKLVCRGRGSSLFMSTPDGLEQERLTADLAFPRNSAFFQAVYYEDPQGILWVGTQGAGLWRARKQVIVTLSEAQGLHDRNIYPILEDHSGAIWIAAWPHSLYRYEHGRIHRFTLSDGLLPFISALYEDRSHNLWVASYDRTGNDGLRILRNGRFIRPPLPKKPGQIKVILEDRSGALWFGCEDKLIRLRGNVVDVFTTRDGLATDDIDAMVEDNSGNLWIGGLGGVTRFSGKSFTGYTVRDGLPSPTVRALYVDAENVLWIGTYDGGLARFENGKFTRYTTREGLFSNGVFQIFEDSNGNLWMGSNQGIYRVRKQELNDFAAGKVRAITSIAYGKGDGMLDSECNGGHQPAGMRARDGTLWFPTQNGVAIINPAKLPERPSPLPSRSNPCR